MANIRKSLDGRKRARTVEYIDSQVDINNDEEPNETTSHVGQHIHAQLDLSMSFIDETFSNEPKPQPIIPSGPSVSKIKKRNSERSYMQRQMSDIHFNRSVNEANKAITELKGRDHILRMMKTTTSKPIMELKNHKLIQEMLAKRQEKQQVNKPMSDFALKYAVIENSAKNTKSPNTSEIITDMTQQLEGLKSTLIKRQTVDPTSPLLRVVKLESVCNQLLCYCQYVTDREDLVLFLNPDDEQSKNLAINDEIRIMGESRLDMNLPELGSVSLGITDVRKESSNHNKHSPMETTHTYEFNCACNTCTGSDYVDQDIATNFDLRSSFPNDTTYQKETSSVDTVFDSFALALISKRKFDLRATIIIYEADKIGNRYLFTVRDGIGHCLQIILSDVNGLHIEIQTKTYIFHQIEFLERIESPKEANRWPYEDYVAPKKLFCFRSINNHVSML